MSLSVNTNLSPITTQACLSFLETVAQKIKNSTLISYDLETEGLDPYSGDRLVGVALRLDQKTEEGYPPKFDSYYFSFRHQEGENYPLELLPDLIGLINDSGLPILMFNAAFDLAFTWAEGLKLENPIYDVMVAAHLNNENEASFQLKKLGEKYLRADAAASERMLMEALEGRGYTGKTAKGQIKMLPGSVVAPYAIEDVNLTHDLGSFLSSKLRKQGLYKLWLESGAYTVALASMMFAGVPIDKDKCESLLAEAKEKAQAVRQELAKLTGIPTFNPRSAPQVCKYLGISSSNKSVLRNVSNPAVPLINEYRGWAHAATSYYGPFLEHVKPDSRIHCRLNQIGTVTGRIAASNPNLMGIAKENDHFHVREVIAAPPGDLLLSFDYSQIELRMLAYYTQSPFMLDVFKRGVDLHQETAEYVGISRDEAKRTNFGASYGVGAEALAENLNCSKARAEEILHRYHSSIPEIKRLYRQMEEQAATDRYITMWTGRRRHYGPLDEYEKALSNLIQGGVGEVMRVTITRLAHLLYGLRTKMILQIHDDILFVGPESEILKLAKPIKTVMEGYNFKNVAIVAEGKIGHNWGQMTKLEELNA